MQWRTGTPSYITVHHKRMCPSFWLAIKFATKYYFALMFSNCCHIRSVRVLESTGR